MPHGVNRNQDGGFAQPQPGSDVAAVYTPHSNVDPAVVINYGGTVYPSNVPYYQPVPHGNTGQWNGGHPGQASHGHPLAPPGHGHPLAPPGHGHPLAPAYPPVSHQPVTTNKGVLVQGAGPSTTGRGQQYVAVTQNGRRGQRQRTNDSTPFICCFVCCFNPCDCDFCCDVCDCSLCLCL